MILIGRQALSKLLSSRKTRFSVDRLSKDSLKRISLGDFSVGETPDPIPNSEVKPCSADGTALQTGWESRASPETSLPLTTHTALEGVLYLKIFFYF